MSLLEYNEIRQGKIIIHNGEPCEVLDSHVARTQQRKPQNQVKLRSLKTGKAYNETFHVSDSADEADLTKQEVKFLFTNKGEYWFADPKDPANRFKLEEKLMGGKERFLKSNDLVSALVWDNDGEEETIGLSLPIKMTFEVKEAAPAVKGDTRTGASKTVVLENNTEVNVPLFINQGDKVVINTQTGEYVERA